MQSCAIATLSLNRTHGSPRHAQARRRTAGSALLSQLNADIEPLQRIDFFSFYCLTDLTVVPGWKAVLPVGPRLALPARRHDRLMRDPASLELVVRELLRP